jgi:hypothetical protein
MKNNARVKLDFMGFKKGELIMFCMYVSLLLFACTFMITPPFTKVEFDAAIKDYQSKAVAAMGKDPAKIKLKDAAEAELKKMARMLSSYVDMMCYGNYDEINQTGFTVYSQDGHSGQIEFTVRQGITSGQVIAEWPKDQNNHGYMFRYSINEDGLRDVFTEVNAGTTGCTINGLSPLKEYMFSYYVVYSDYIGEYCDPVFLTVL